MRYNIQRILFIFELLLIFFSKLHFSLSQFSNLDDYFISYKPSNDIGDFKNYIQTVFDDKIKSDPDGTYSQSQNQTISSINQKIPGVFEIILEKSIADYLKDQDEISSLEPDTSTKVGFRESNKAGERSFFIDQSNDSESQSTNRALKINTSVSIIKATLSLALLSTIPLLINSNVPKYTVQSFPPWQLSAISSMKNDYYSIFPYGSDFITPVSNKVVIIYVIDSGVDANVSELSGRVITGKNFVEEENDDDLAGHGTAIASVIAGTLNGVAKTAKIVSVKVLNAQNTGKLGHFLSALEWVVEDKKANYADNPVIINFSINIETESNALKSAFQYANDNGILSVVSAGNDGKDACSYPPSGYPSVITVASHTANNTFDSSFSNYGKCVDILAPGEFITSSVAGTSNKIQLISGTSLAAGIVTGVVSSVLSRYPKLSPNQAKSEVLNAGIQYQIDNLPDGTINKRVWNGYKGKHSRMTFI
ncbi:hypothetical protein BB560_002304 [Smittium megazygosporum]|uniref:Peptidase S8/S53 domain-containing protein n=1 Tax=Smittium megazygosporum TaxID=133381 RepID=A0A2T9ZF94_9FUNG|nr:hypothetical protein BB560_002304 [Smittium megazygosporum]